MASYKLTANAEEDLWRIYQWGFRHHGEAAADEYYSAFFDRFEQVAEQPLLYSTAEDIRKAYRSCVCGVDTIYYRLNESGVEIMAILGRQSREKIITR
ncbi:MAG: plasmid stabilization protein [SAR86 cluster bacterium]|uniref:Plasmid stabilization protein n=1 Tax=SAR86 cluster bacterium TaxID=2030880 RepID=A0A2A5ARE3_9GAMM|nr:MAG: plasmid stabilization protein [SAR86 cluster bacterium]